MPVADPGSTNPELLKLLADMGQGDAWTKFMGIYSPMIGDICAICGLQHEEVEDVRSQVMLRLVQAFLSREGRVICSFRGYLKKIIANEINEFLRTKHKQGNSVAFETRIIDNIASRNAELQDDLEWIETNIHHRLEGLQRFMTAARSQVGKETWKTFWMMTVQGVSCADAATQQGITYFNAYQRNLRVMELIRREAGLADD